MKSPNYRQQGQLVADFLAGSWRASQTRLEMSPKDLERVTSLLYNSGGAGLAWWRIHESDLAATPCGELLHQGYRLQALQTPINEERILRAFRLLRGAEIEPTLVKGWAAAQFYPHQTFRPYGDIDLVVRPAEYARARETLKQDEEGTWWVDLHKGLPELDDRSVEGLFERSRMLALQDVPIRVLSFEDHLALLAIHLFKHGGWRPTWLCDIAAMVEALPENFEASICLGSNKNRAAWIACGINLAHQLLGANVAGLKLEVQQEDLPEWIVRAVLEQWGNLFQAVHLPVQPRPLMASAVRSPRRLVKEIRERWPRPIVATFNLRGQPNNLPRLPYQLGSFAAQAGRYLFDHLRATQ
ncbi:MAG: hypothetical protein QOH41_631 [Blastocatellia bacterium]|jgi:hypothetical protein|nr:hypothetical protein [Blastocatellia bacterium]